MLKLYSRSAACLLVLMAPIWAGAPPVPYCPTSSTLSLSPSNASTSRLVITLMDEWMKKGVMSPTLELVELQCPTTLTPSPPVAFRLWHIISPVICGQIEDEKDKEIFCPHENRWVFQRCKLLRVVSFFPSWRTLLLYKGLVSYSVMDSWWVAIMAHFQKMSCHFFLLGWHRTVWLSLQESDFYYIKR